MSRNRLSSVVVAAFVVTIAALGFTPRAGAVVLAPGATVATPGTTVAVRPALAGTVIEDVLRPFKIATSTGVVIAQGSLQDRVVRETSTGTLDFYFRIITDAGNSGDIDLIDKTNFSGLTTDVDWRIDGLGTVNPTEAARSSNGSTVLFDFLQNVIPANSQSRFVFIKTNATTYQLAGTTTVYAKTVATVAASMTGHASITTFEPIAPAGNGLHIYQLLGPDMTQDHANAIAGQFNLVPQTKPVTTANLESPVVYVDSHNPTVARMIYQGSRGSFSFFPDLTMQSNSVTSPEGAVGVAADFITRESLLPAVQDKAAAAIGTFQAGEVISLANQGSAANKVGAPSNALDADDVIRTVHYYRTMDGLTEVGPDSLLSVDVGASGVVGFSRTVRPIALTTLPAVQLTADQVGEEFSRTFLPIFDGVLKTSPGSTYSITSRKLVYYEQGERYIQPAYQYNVVITSKEGLQSGETLFLPAVQKSPESIINNLIAGQAPTVPTSTGTTDRDAGLIAHGSTPIQYGIYVVRDDNRFLDDAWGSHLNLQAGNAPLAGLGIYPAVNFNQYYFDYPWMWENDPADSIPDNSPYFVGANNLIIYEGHGAPWVVSTYSNSPSYQEINYPTITGYGAYNGTNGKTDYIAWHTCDSIPAPGDPYGFDYQAPATPFDVWFTIFKGMRGTYGARTTVNIYDGVGPAWSFAAGLGVPNLSAWFTAETNCVTGHSDNWNMGSAVLISGHEGDCIYDTAPLPAPGSLTIWWQHP